MVRVSPSPMLAVAVDTSSQRNGPPRPCLSAARCGVNRLNPTPRAGGAPARTASEGTHVTIIRGSARATAFNSVSCGVGINHDWQAPGFI